MELTAKNVDAILKACAGDRTGSIRVYGIKIEVDLHPDKCDKHREDIKDMLKQLPDEFHKGKGNGWSFLNMCVRKDGVQWADVHITMDKLLCLGIAIDAVTYCIPNRDLWSVFPGNMPYICVNVEE